jgi:hypothetical protein
MGWDVLKVINRGNASGAAFQTGMCGDIFDQFTSYPDAAPIPEAFEKFFSSTYRHFPKLSPNLYQNDRDPAAQQGLPIAQNYLITGADVNLQDYLACKDDQTFIFRQSVAAKFAIRPE